MPKRGSPWLAIEVEILERFFDSMEVTLLNRLLPIRSVKGIRSKASFLDLATYKGASFLREYFPYTEKQINAYIAEYYYADLGLEKTAKMMNMSLYQAWEFIESLSNMTPFQTKAKKELSITEEFSLGHVGLERLALSTPWRNNLSLTPEMFNDYA